MTPEPQVGELMSILRGRRRSILAITAIGTALVLFGSLMIPPQYTATSEIIIETPAAFPGEAAPGAGQMDHIAIVQTHATALISRANLERVLDSLLQDPKFRAAQATPPSRLRQSAAALWHKFGQPLWQGLAPLLPTSAHAPSPAQADASRLEAFQRNLSVYQQGGADIIAVSFKSTSPDLAALAANRVAQVYVQSEEDRQRAQVSQVESAVDERMPGVKESLKRAEQELQDYRVAHGLADANHTNLADQKRAALSAQLIAAEADLAKRRAELAAAQGPHPTGSSGAPFAGAVSSPAEDELRRQENALLNAEAEARITLGDNHPKVRELAAQLREVHQKLADEAARTTSRLASEARVAADQVTALRAQLNELQAADGSAQQAEARMSELEQEAAAAGQIYTGLVQRREQLRTLQMITKPMPRVLSLAVPPVTPSSTSRLVFVLPALIVFSIGASLRAVLAERLQNGMRTVQDVNDALGIPCVGFVPLIRCGGKIRPHQHLLQNPYAAYTEAIRSVVATLQLTTRSGVPKVILVSSSLPNEGKTTLAVSLAAYFALIGRRTLLIDLDFRRSAVGRELEGQSRANANTAMPPAVESWLGGIRQVSDVQLDYMPVPGNPADPLVPFVGDTIRRLLDHVRDTYDSVVIDSPPLLAVAEARLLANMADKVLFAVQWGKTPRVVAQDALDLLCDHGHAGASRSDVVSAVFTQVDLKEYAQYRYGGLGTVYRPQAPSTRVRRLTNQATNAGVQPTLPFPTQGAVDETSEPHSKISLSASARRMGRSGAGA